MRRRALAVVGLLVLVLLIAATTRAIFEAGKPIVIRDRVERDDAFGIAFSPDDELIGKASRRGARVLSLDGKLVRTLIPRGVVHAIAFTPDGERVVTGDHEGNVIVWSARTGAVERRLPGHASRVLALAIAPDGTLIVSSGRDEVVRIAAIAEGTVARVFSFSDARAIAFAPRGDRIAIATPILGTHVLSLADGTVAVELPRAEDVAFARDGSCVALARPDGGAEVRSAVNGDLVRVLVESRTGCLATRVAAAGDRWVVARGDASSGEVLIFAPDGKLSRRFEVPVLIQSLAVSPDGARVAVGGVDGAIWIWRTSGPFAR